MRRSARAKRSHERQLHRPDRISQAFGVAAWTRAGDVREHGRPRTEHPASPPAWNVTTYGVRERQAASMARGPTNVGYEWT